MEKAVIRRRKKMISIRTTHSLSKLKLLMSVLTLTTVAIVAFFSFGRRVCSVASVIAQTRMSELMSEAISESVRETMSTSEMYQSMVSISNATENSALLQTNTPLVNLAASNCVANIQSKLNALCEQGISIPLGTLSGIPFLSNLGPNVTVRLQPCSAVRYQYVSSIKSSGINQTLYCVNLRVTAGSNIIFPGALNSVCAEIDVPIAQSVIIGDVPDAYTDVNNEEDMLNLVPSADD